jgi:hypothetical protein
VPSRIAHFGQRPTSSECVADERMPAVMNHLGAKAIQAQRSAMISSNTLFGRYPPRRYGGAFSCSVRLVGWKWVS